MAMLPVWKIVGFVLYIVLYFNVLDAYNERPKETFTSVFFKLLPMMHLIFVLVSSSMEDEENARSTNYRFNVLIGLLASCVGDYLLVYSSDYFIPGAIAFAIAHCFYIGAFGLRPFGSGPLAASVIVLAIATYFFTLEPIPLSAVKVACVGYIGIIGVMAWRSAIQLSRAVNLENLCAFVGALLFVLSDIVLTFIFFRGSFYYAPFWNMLLYYTAQLFITLSASITIPADYLSKNK